MKKAAFVLVAVLLMASFVLAGCATPASPTTAPAETTAPVATTAPATTGTYKIGILAPAVTHGWVAAVAYNAEARAKELGSEVEYKLYTSTNAEEMTSQLDDLQTWGAQAIVAFPQWQGMEVPIQAAIDKGITVVNFDIEIAAKGVYRVAGDNKDMGVQGAKYIVDKIGKDRHRCNARGPHFRFRFRAAQSRLCGNHGHSRPRYENHHLRHQVHP